ncbi:MAG TPA: C-type lectin domain-containing protein, partial [Kofleriaceae bacterium]|nr:C-type lectin domain-containing protein [Kofleriaceae bacterium]
MRAVFSLFALVALAGSSAGCLRTTEFKCTSDADCSASGAVCESTSYCSFTDTDCAMGRRYGELSGPYSNQCVGETSMNDGGIDGPDGGTGNCPATYAALPGAGGHVYKLTNNSQQWSTQRDRCANEGAYLAIPDDANELMAITTAAAAAKTWIGISDTAMEMTYVTVKMTPATFLPWASGEP